MLKKEWEFYYQIYIHEGIEKEMIISFLQVNFVLFLKKIQ
jgi:hypothetical protein